MRVLLTGASGFLGGHVALSLAEAGHALRLLARRRASVADLGEGFEVIEGDLLDREVRKAAVEGVEAVVHVAGLVKRWVRDPSIFDRVNVEASDALCEAALAAGARRFVFCSSFFALGPSDGRRAGDESMLHDDAPRTDYERTKLDAEKLMRARQEEGDPIVILYPGVVYGPGRLTEGNLVAGLARDLIEGRLPGTVGPGDRRLCLAFAEDVARGFTLALERAPSGSRYILGGENIPVRALLHLIAEASGMGVRVPARRIPYGVASALGRFERLLAQLFGREPRLTDEEVAVHRHHWAYESNKAIEELGYTITPLPEGIERLVSWLLRDGRARPPARAAKG